jgi:hypothetical protein
MNPNSLIIATFLLGAAVGGILVAMFYRANFARIKEEFQEELQATVEAESDSRRQPASSSQPANPSRAA